MLAASLLLLPVMTAFALLFAPAVQASINPGNEIMTASNYTFQSDTFSAAGSIGSLAGTANDPAIITGQWSLVVENDVADFMANLTIVNASGLGYQTVQLSNISSTEVSVNENGTATVKGVLDITIDGAEKLTGVNATIKLAKMRALNMTLGGPDYLTDPIYGTADPPQETVPASAFVPEGSGIYGNVSEKFRLPQLPNPFK